MLLTLLDCLEQWLNNVDQTHLVQLDGSSKRTTLRTFGHFLSFFEVSRSSELKNFELVFNLRRIGSENFVRFQQLPHLCKSFEKSMLKVHFLTLMRFFYEDALLFQTLTMGPSWDLYYKTLRIYISTYLVSWPIHSNQCFSLFKNKLGSWNKYLITDQ